MRGNGKDCQKFDCDVSGAAPGRLGWRTCSRSDTFAPARNASKAAGLTPAFALKASEMKTTTAHFKPDACAALHVWEETLLPIMWLATWIWISLSFSKVIWHLMHWYVFFCLETKKKRGGGN